MSRNRRSLELPLTEDCGLPRAPARTDSEPEARSKPSGQPSRMSFRNRGAKATSRAGSAPSPTDRSAVHSPAGTEDTEGQEVKEGVSHNAPIPVKPAGGLTGTGPSRRHPKCRFCGRLHGCQRSSTRGSAVGTVDKHYQI